MSSMFERPEQNKIFLIYGNLDDMFLSPDLQKNNFRPFLNDYLRSLGYERIVFYSGAKNMGKYVLDDRSAMLAINKNRASANADSQHLTSGTSSNAPKKKRRILNPQAPAADNAAPAAAVAVEDQGAAPLPIHTPEKLIYKQPKITPAEFLDDAKVMIADSSVKTAVVFTFFQDFVTDSSAPLQQYNELLSHLWDEYGLTRNQNICIFLAPQMNAETLTSLFDRLMSGNVFRSRFFNTNGTMNRSCTLHIGLPNRDEFGYLLEYLRIMGDGGKRIVYPQKEIPAIVSSLMYLSREADREENRSGYLSSVYENIVRYMQSQPDETVPFSVEAVKRIYHRFHAEDISDPMETLRTTKGWEPVAARISEIVSDYQIKKARFLSRQPSDHQQSRHRVCANERIDTPDDKIAFEYPIPHFVIKGNPGVGKTTMARLIGQIFYEAGLLKNGVTVEATKEDLVDMYVGGTPIKTRGKILEANEGVLFIDDAYSLIDKTEEHNYSKEAIDELVAAMTNPKQYRFCLILAGYPEPMETLLKMNAGLRSRFGASNILTVEDYPPALLTEIFIDNCRKDGYRFWGEQAGENEPLDLPLFFENLYAQRDRAHFGNARDVIAIARDVKMQASLRDDTSRCIMQSDFKQYQHYFKSRGSSSIDDIYDELDQYVGLEFVRELFDNVRLELADAEDCQRRGVKPDVLPDHYIFAGNPGTGKTTVGKLMGRFYHMMGVLGASETMFTDASALIGNHVGDSQSKVAETLREAIDHNALLYIDEAYQIADTAYSSEIVGAMMTSMTENAADFKIIFGMYANRVEDFLKLNAGLARRVRIVEFPDYTPQQLMAIFDKTVAAQGRHITDEARHTVSLLMEHRYQTRDEHFGNAGEVKHLVADMKRRLLRRTEETPDADRYTYTQEDIPPQQLDLIRDRIHPRTFDDIMKELKEQVGLSALKEIILQKQEELLYAQKSGRSVYDIIPGYYFFVGNPGTGKTTGAKLFAACLRELGIVKSDRFLVCTAKDLIGQYVGETDKKTYALLQKSMNGVLLIDEAYSLSYADDVSGNVGFKKEALEQLIAFMDDPEHRRSCCIILAGYEKDMQGLYRSNSGMRSRIEEVRFPDYSPDELYAIFEQFCHKGGYLVEEGVKAYYLPIFERMTRAVYYSNGRTARTVYEKTLANLRRRVIYSDSLTEEQQRTILCDDLLSEEVCMAIVTAGS